MQSNSQWQGASAWLKRRHDTFERLLRSAEEIVNMFIMNTSHIHAIEKIARETDGSGQPAIGYDADHGIMGRPGTASAAEANADRINAMSKQKAEGRVQDWSRFWNQAAHGFPIVDEYVGKAVGGAAGAIGGAMAGRLHEIRDDIDAKGVWRGFLRPAIRDGVLATYGGTPGRVAYETASRMMPSSDPYKVNGAWEGAKAGARLGWRNPGLLGSAVESEASGIVSGFAPSVAGMISDGAKNAVNTFQDAVGINRWNDYANARYASERGNLLREVNGDDWYNSYISGTLPDGDVGARDAEWGDVSKMLGGALAGTAGTWKAFGTAFGAGTKMIGQAARPLAAAVGVDPAAAGLAASKVAPWLLTAHVATPDKSRTVDAVADWAHRKYEKHKQDAEWDENVRRAAEAVSKGGPSAREAGARAIIDNLSEYGDGGIDFASRTLGMPREEFVNKYRDRTTAKIKLLLSEGLDAEKCKAAGLTMDEIEAFANRLESGNLSREEKALMDGVLDALASE